MCAAEPRLAYRGIRRVDPRASRGFCSFGCAFLRGPRIAGSSIKSSYSKSTIISLTEAESGMTPGVTGRGRHDSDISKWWRRMVSSWRSGTPYVASTGDVEARKPRARREGTGILRFQHRSTEATYVLATISVKVSQFMPVRLTVKEGPHQGREFEFEEHDTFIVGRSARAQFRLPLKDTSLSRVHFMVEVNPPQCRLTDLGSTNGTKVNGR